MPIDQARYHPWQGQLRSPWFACLAIVRVALLQVFRRKLYWVVLALGLTQFLLYWAIIYAVTQLRPPREVQEGMLANFGFSAQDSGTQDNGYVMFMSRQSTVVMMLLAFSGSLLVGSDFRLQSLPFYLSRRIDRRHYIVGKLLAVATIVSLLTTLPALLLFIEYGMFTSSTQYWLANWRTLVAVLAYGLVMSTVLSILLVSLASWLQRVAPIAITWSSSFVLLALLAVYLSEETQNDHWRLIDPWRDIQLVGKLVFGVFRDDTEFRMALWALAILSTVCAIALAALVRRVRAVEIVE